MSSTMDACMPLLSYNFSKCNASRSWKALVAVADFRSSMCSAAGNFQGLKRDEFGRKTSFFVQIHPNESRHVIRVKCPLFAMQEVASKATRKLILEDGYRVDGRGVTDVRAIWSRAGCLPRAHGSALFTRGETQALAVTTLGMTVVDPSSGNSVVTGFQLLYIL